MQVNRTALSNALRELARITPSKPSMPILSHVLVQAVGGVLTLRATDVNTTLTAELEADGDLAACCIPLKPLAAMCKLESKRDTGTVAIDLDDTTATVIVDGVTSKLPTLPADDFPQDANAPFQLVGVWPERPFAEAINHVLPAASNDATRPHLCCVALVGDTAVATDGHRLHTAKLPAATPEPLLLPVPAASALCHILTGDDAVVIAKADKRLKLRVRGWTLETRLVDAEFPPYEQVIPRSSEVHLSVDTAQLTRAFKRLAGVSLGRGVRVAVNGSIELSASDPGHGESRLTVTLLENDHVGDDDLVLGVNPAYVIDALGKDARPVRLNLGGCLDPLVVRHDDGRLAVVMPMRV